MARNEQHTLCSVCFQNPAAYTCPRCSRKSCSLQCSKLHKEQTSCNGERNKAAYVPMNKYTWGTMMDDYSYLEDASRVVAQWGQEIRDKGIARGSSAQRRGGSRGRGKGNSTRNNKQSKRDMLQSHLHSRGVYLELLPTGMHRRSLNKSSYNPKSKSALLTLELVLNPPTDTVAGPCNHLVHGISLDLPLLSVIKSAAQGFRHADTKPAWALDLLSVEDDIEFDERIIALEEPESGTGHGSLSKRYRRVNPTHVLWEVLRDHPFIEFPRFFVWAEDSFCGTLCDLETGDISVRRPPLKKRQAKPSSTKDLMELLGGYGSNDDESHQGDSPDGMGDILEGYQSESEISQAEETGDQDMEEGELRAGIAQEGEWQDDSDTDSLDDGIDVIAHQIVAERRGGRNETIT